MKSKVALLTTLASIALVLTACTSKPATTEVPTDVAPVTQTAAPTTAPSATTESMSAPESADAAASVDTDVKDVESLLNTSFEKEFPM